MARFASCVFVLVACGHAKPPPATTTTTTTTTTATTPAQPDDTTGKCEPGRCLEDITHLIQDHRAATRACYDKGLKRVPTIEGRIIINFTIDSDGKITEASQGMQDNQIEEPGVVACVTDVIKSIKFAKSPSGKTTRAYHRFEFSRH